MMTDAQKRLVRSLADQAAAMVQQERNWNSNGVPNDFYAGAAIGLKTAAKHAASFFRLQNKLAKNKPLNVESSQAAPDVRHSTGVTD